ncbi:hypothetical protein ACP275_12G026800 [Erythranthe tilingii]
MVRPLPEITSLHMQKLPFLPAPVTFFIALAAVFSLFTTVSFLCGSHGEKKNHQKTVRLGGGGGGNNPAAVIEKIKDRLSGGKAVLMAAKMISWRKVQDEREDVREEFGGDCGEEEREEDENDAVWKKGIMKGEKCRPLDFSGKILYDCDGNLLQD